MAKQYGEEAKRKFHATAQRKRLNPRLTQAFDGLASPDIDFPD